MPLFYHFQVIYKSRCKSLARKHERSVAAYLTNTDDAPFNSKQFQWNIFKFLFSLIFLFYASQNPIFLTVWGWYNSRLLKAHFWSNTFKITPILLHLQINLKYGTVKVVSYLWNVSLLEGLTNLTLSWRRPLSYRNQSIDL